MVLPINFENFVDDEVDELNLFIYETLKIPDSASSWDICSYFLYLLEGGNPESSKKLTKKGEQYHADFKKLCNLAPHVPLSVLEVISLAYGSLAVLYECKPNGKFIQNNEKEVITYIMLSSYARGIASTLFERAPLGNNLIDEIEQQKQLSSAVNFILSKIKNDQSKKLSIAGLRGANSRNRPFETLKKWALEKSNGMQASHRDIARKLYAELPPHLADISNDPMRLIYDTLRAKKKSN
jgi:hypothetical protein